MDSLTQTMLLTSLPLILGKKDLKIKTQNNDSIRDLLQFTLPTWMQIISLGQASTCRTGTIFRGFAVFDIGRSYLALSTAPRKYRFTTNAAIKPKHLKRAAEVFGNELGHKNLAMITDLFFITVRQIFVTQERMYTRFVDQCTLDRKVGAGFWQQDVRLIQPIYRIPNDDGILIPFSVSEVKTYTCAEDYAENFKIAAKLWMDLFSD